MINPKLFIKIMLTAFILFAGYYSVKQWYGITMFTKGIYYDNHKDYLNAIRNLKKAENNVPTYNRIYYERAKIWAHTGDRARAYHDMKRCEKYYPDWANTREIIKIMEAPSPKH